jgi:amidase
MTTSKLDPFATAGDMLRALSGRQVSAVELLELHVVRIARHDPTLNAVVIRDFVRARHAAEGADAARARGETGALLGLPMTLKESINVKGLRTTVGVPEWSGFVSEHDAPATTRVRAAGAVVLGKTNVPPVLADWQADNPIFGRTVNPWDPLRTPGGSTGGGAAALAAGLTPLEVGSDIGGSIRVPAAFCGVYGHKPSETALPRSGQFPYPPMPNAAVAMGVQGPLARSAEDLERALDVLCGPDTGEDLAWRLEIPPARHARLRDFRVAVLPPIDWLPLDGEILAALERVASRLESAGATLKRAQPEIFGDHRRHHALYRMLLAAVTSARLPEAERRQRVEIWKTRDDEFGRAALRGLQAGAADYIGYFGQREHFRAAFRAFFREWDVLLAPITLGPAFPHVAKPYPPDAKSLHDTVEVDGRTILYDLQLVYPAVPTLAGQPATAFPVGLTRAGLPIGLQVIGPYLEDRTPIRFAALLAREIGGFTPPAGYA